MIKCLKGLNPSQLVAATSIEGAIQIDAVAGSGKTKTLVSRIGYMLEQGVKPKSIMVTTFTKKATEEMTTRLGSVINKMQLSQITIGTTHSIGFRILKKEYANLGHHLASAFKQRDRVLINGSLKIFAEKIKKDILYDRTIQSSVKEELNDIAIPQLMKAIGLSKCDGIDNHEYERLNDDKGIRMLAYIEFYNRYEERKWQEQKIDTDDMLFLLVRLFEEHPDILKKYQKIYKYIMVDEAQDCNNQQYKLIKMLGSPEHNIFVVGDIDQNMYSFRGANPKQFLDFSTNYRNVKRIPLEDNYRSNPQILDIANTLIVNNTERLPKKLKAHKQNTKDKVVSYNRYENEDEEADNIVKEIKVLRDKENFNYKDIALLYRTNAQSRSLEDKLIMSSIPYVIHGGISFYERKEVKDIIAYLQLIVDPGDNKAFQRIINVPSRYLGKAFMEKIKSIKGSYVNNLEKNMYTLKNYEQNGIENFLNTLDGLLYVKNTGTPVEMVDFLLGEGGYKKYILDDEEEEDSSRMENIETLKFAISKYSKVEEFLDYIELMTSMAKQSIDGVQLLTIHKSKGLEFPVVFSVGVSEGILPHFKSIEESTEGGNPLAIEEERRLMYVAVTRAESKVYISSIDHFNGRPQPLSRFIKDMNFFIPEEEVAFTSIKCGTKQQMIDDLYKESGICSPEEENILLHDMI